MIHTATTVFGSDADTEINRHLLANSSQLSLISGQKLNELGFLSFSAGSTYRIQKFTVINMQYRTTRVWHFKELSGPTDGKPDTGAETGISLIASNVVRRFDIGNDMSDMPQTLSQNPGIEHIPSDSIQISCRHLRGMPPPDGAGEQETVRWLKEVMITQASSMTDTVINKHIIVSSDGMNLWPAAVGGHKRHKDYPYLKGILFRNKASMEIFHRSVSRKLLTGTDEDITERDRRMIKAASPTSGAAVRQLAGKLRIDRLVQSAESVDDIGPIRLSGWSGSYGVLSTDRISIHRYLNLISEHMCNLTRVWANEQWTGSICPWSVNLRREFDLSKHNPVWWDRLEKFLRVAQELGIVVILSAFDRAGLKNVSGKGRWQSSPFNARNQSTSRWKEFGGDPIRGSYNTHIWQTDNDLWREVMYPYFFRLGKVCARYRNVIIELCNEFGSAIPITQEMGVTWHIEAAKAIRDGEKEAITAGFVI